MVRTSGEQRSKSSHFKGPNERQRKLADVYVNQGKSFKEAVLAAGYSPTLAKLGPRALRRHSVGINTAIEEAAKQKQFDAKLARAKIRERLLGDIIAGKSSGVARECELLGRDKEVDMWTRAGDAYAVGIFACLVGDAGKELDSINLTGLASSGEAAAETKDLGGSKVM